MAQSLNTKVDLVMDATSFHGMNNYGKIMIGDRGFEYYNEKKMNDYIQIPWEEVDYVIASVMFKGKYIPRFAIQTKKSGTFTFVLLPNRLRTSYNQMVNTYSADQLTPDMSMLLHRATKQESLLLTSSSV